MEPPINVHHQGQRNRAAFLFGATFNVLASFGLVTMLDYVLQALIGGVICLLFKIIGDLITPFITKLQKKVQGVSEKTANIRRLPARPYKKNVRVNIGRGRKKKSKKKISRKPLN